MSNDRWRIYYITSCVYYLSGMNLGGRLLMRAIKKKIIITQT